MVAGGLLAVAVACASAPKAVVTTPDPERTVLELRTKNAGYVRRIEELENRVFILEDQLDSRALASEQRAPAALPKPPVKAAAPAAADHRGQKPTIDPTVEPTLGPAPDPAIDPAIDPRMAPAQTSLLAEHAVDYAGDAALADPAPAEAVVEGKRPMLRLTSSSRAPEPRAEAQSGTASRQSPAALKLYREALEVMRTGHADAARVGFRRFLEANPQHDYADNAQYWIGECDYAAGNLGAAERSFRLVVEKYPRGNKVPDAMLKLGFTLQALGDEAAGRAVLESLTRAFPRHEAARLAGARLARTEPRSVSMSTSTSGASSKASAGTLSGMGRR